MAHRPADEGPSTNIEEIACACIGARAPGSERVPAKKTESTANRVGLGRTLVDTMLPEYQNLPSYFQEIKQQYAQAKTLKEKLDLLKIAREILKQAQEHVAQFQDDIDRMRKS